MSKYIVRPQNNFNSLYCKQIKALRKLDNFVIWITFTDNAKYEIIASVFNVYSKLAQSFFIGSLIVTHLLRCNMLQFHF